MKHLRRIEITEYHPRKIVHNYSMETISSKLIDNINDVHIIVHKSPDIHDDISPYPIIKKEVSFEYNSNFEKIINENENEIFWGIRLKVNDFKFSHSKLKPKNLTPNDLIINKTEIKNFDDFLNHFFIKNKKWDSNQNNTHLYIDKNKIRALFSQEAIFYTNIFKWELFENSEELKRELLEKTGQSIIPIFQM